MTNVFHTVAQLIKATETAMPTPMSRRSFLGVTVSAPLALALPAMVSQAGCVAANDNGPIVPPQPPASSAAQRPNPHGFPNETREQVELLEFYGDPLDNSVITRVRSPYRLKISGMPGQYRTELQAHHLVADSLGNVLESVLSVYGFEEIDRLGLNIFGGDHVDRLMTGADRWSTHAFGIAYDFHPSANRYRMGRDQALFAAPEYEPWWKAWRDEGWFALGPERNFDYMHVQAAIRVY